MTNAPFRRVLGLIALGGAAVLAVSACTGTTDPTPSPSTPSSAAVVDPSVPSTTPSTVATLDPAPTVSASATPSATPSSAAKGAVTPFITSAVWDSSRAELDVSAIVPKVVESGGTCTVTATRAGVTRTAGAAASASAQSTGCSPLTIAGSQLTAGSWSVTVSYASAKSAGTSAARSVQVTK